MSEHEDAIIRRAYAEASLAAMEKGLSGIAATKAVLAAAAKVSTRLLGRTITPDQVQQVMR